MANVSLDPIDILLELGFDLDEISDDKSYQSALKEGIVTIEFRTGGSGDERSRALREELIKTRKKGSKKTTVDAAKAFISPKALPGGVGRRGGTLTVGQTLLSSSAKNKQQQQQKKTSVFDVIADSLNAVANSLNNVAKSISELLGVERQTAEAARQGAVTATRQKEEKDRLAGAENLISGLTAPVINAVKKPAMGILDRIKTFLGNVAAGSVVGWLTNEGNKDKVLGVFNFLEEHMGKIMTGIIALLGLGIGMKLVGLITKLIGVVKLLGTGIAKILGLAGKIPGFAAAAKFVAPVALMVGAPIALAAGAGKGYEAIRSNMAGGGELATLDSELRARLAERGIAESGKYRLGQGGKNIRGGTGLALNEEDQALYDQYKALQEQRAETQKARDAELKAIEERYKSDESNLVKQGSGRNARMVLSPEAKARMEEEQAMVRSGADMGARRILSGESAQDFLGERGSQYALPQIKLDQNYDFGQDSVNLSHDMFKPQETSGPDMKTEVKPNDKMSKVTANIKRTQSQQQRLQDMDLSAVDYFGGGSVVSQMEERKSAMANGGMSAGASADQQEVPSFSAVDLTNDNIFMTSGIYNSPS